MGITLQICPQNGASSRYPCPAGVCLVLFYKFDQMLHSMSYYFPDLNIFQFLAQPF